MFLDCRLGFLKTDFLALKRTFEFGITENRVGTGVVKVFRESSVAGKPTVHGNLEVFGKSAETETKRCVLVVHGVKLVVLCAK